jgi:predicted acyl esterase
MYRVWMQHEATTRGMEEVPGRWVAEEAWPSPRITPSTYFFTGDGLDTRMSATHASKRLKPLQTVGITAPVCYFRSDRLNTGLPTDQRIDDARSLSYDSARLATDLEILGAPAVVLDLEVDKPVAFLSVRLNEIVADGVSRRVSFGILNLTHRNSDEFPEPMEPGRITRVQVQLHDCAHRFKNGNRLRVAVSTTYWPAFWPSPEAATLTLHAGELSMPLRPPRPEDATLRPFGPKFVPETSNRTTLTAPLEGTSIREWDVAQEKLTIRNTAESGKWRLDATGTEMATSWSEVTEILDCDPTSARIEISKEQSYSRGE